MCLYYSYIVSNYSCRARRGRGDADEDEEDQGSEERDGEATGGDEMDVDGEAG